MVAGLPGAEPVVVRTWADASVRLTHIPRGPGAAPSPAIPATDPQCELALVGDVRLSAHDELRHALGLEAVHDLGDPDLVLASYQQWGGRFVEHLTGDFAFALWDARHRRLVCARDPFGSQPVYYHLSPSLLALASDPEAILRLPGIPRRLHARPLVEYLFGCYDDTESTPWVDIRRLPPGAAMVVSPDAVHTRSFWQPEAVPELRLGSDGDYEEAFRTALADAVRSRLAPTGVGVSLSGGLDSSSLTCIAQPFYSGGRLTTISAVFDREPGSDERLYSAAAAAHVGADNHHCHPEQTSPLADGELAPWTGPAPSCDHQAASSRTISEAAGDHGVSVLLSGVGGDSVVSHGVAYLTELAGTGHAGRFLTEARALARRHDRPLIPLVRKYGLRPFVPDAIRRARSAHEGQERTIGRIWAPVRPDVFDSLGLAHRAASLSRRRPARTSPRGPSGRDHERAPAVFVGGRVPGRRPHGSRTALPVHGPTAGRTLPQHARRAEAAGRLDPLGNATSPG